MLGLRSSQIFRDHQYDPSKSSVQAQEVFEADWLFYRTFANRSQEIGLIPVIGSTLTLQGIG